MDIAKQVPRDCNKPTVVVIGATGFFGKYIVDELQRLPVSVVLIGRNAHKVVNIKADIRFQGAWQEELSKEKISAVIHLAGHPRIKDVAKARRTHIDGLQNVLDAIQKSRPWMLLVSSGAVYGDIPPSLFPIPETQECEPLTEYGHLKLMQESIVTARQDHLGGICIVRPSNLIGPGLSDKFFLGNLVEKLSKETSTTGIVDVKLGSLAGTRDFLDVRDASRAISSLVQARIEGTFNLSTGKEVPLREVVDLCLNHLNTTCRIVEDEDIFPPSISRQALSCSKLMKVIDWRASSPLTQTIDDMFDFLSSG